MVRSVIYSGMYADYRVSAQVTGLHSLFNTGADSRRRLQGYIP